MSEGSRSLVRHTQAWAHSNAQEHTGKHIMATWKVQFIKSIRGCIWVSVRLCSCARRHVCPVTMCSYPTLSCQQPSGAFLLWHSNPVFTLPMDRWVEGRNGWEVKEWLNGENEDKEVVRRRRRRRRGEERRGKRNKGKMIRACEQLLVARRPPVTIATCGTMLSSCWHHTCWSKMLCVCVCVCVGTN